MRTLFNHTLLAMLTLAWGLAIAPPPAEGQAYLHTFQVNGFDRKAKIYPPANPSASAPVLFYFHGYSGHVEDSDTRRQFQVIWPEAIIVYAEGRIPYSGSQPLAGWRIRFPYIHEVCGEDEDLEYIDEIMDHLEDNFNVDHNRVYASGHSSGAFFTLALMELKPDLFKGFALVGAYSRYRVNANGVDCSDDTSWTSATPLELAPRARSDLPRPVLYLFGTMENFDYDGPNARRSYSSSCNDDSDFRNTVDELLTRNYGSIPSCDRERDDYIKTDVKQVFPPTSRLGATTQVWLYGAGHSWEDFPGDANQEVVDFFKSLAPSWETNLIGSTSFGPWRTVLAADIPDWDTVVFADFNGDGLSDAFQRQAAGYWKISYLSTSGFGAWNDVGSAGSIPFDNMRFGDFNGDGKTDVFARLSNGQWQINYLGSSSFGAWQNVGSAGSIPLANMRFGDFDGDGKTDVFVRDPNGQWRINYMGNSSFGAWQNVGSAGSIPLANMRFGDFDGDGKTDVFVRENNGQWRINYMGSNTFGPWHDVGSAGSIPLVTMRLADFDGDGKTDVFVRQNNGQWQINFMGSNTFGPWRDVGSAGSTRLPDMAFADFDGDGKTDVVRLVD